MFRSLRVRIALSHALVLLVILIALGVMLQFVLARTLDSSVTRQLTASAQGVAARIREAGKPVPPPDSDVPSDAATQLAVYTPSGVLVGEHAETPSWLRPGSAPVTDLEASGQRVRVVTAPVRGCRGTSTAAPSTASSERIRPVPARPGGRAWDSRSRARGWKRSTAMWACRRRRAAG